MSYVFEDKKKIITRIRRIKGQLDAVERGLDQEKDCFAVLQTLSICRGGINGLVSELIEDHVKGHVIQDPSKLVTDQDKAAMTLIKLLRTYWK